MIRLTVRLPGTGREVASRLLNKSPNVAKVAAAIIRRCAESLGVSPLALEWEARKA
jgi:hypothetical protein